MVWDTNTLTTNAAQRTNRGGDRWVFCQEFRGNNMDGVTPIDSVAFFPGGAVYGGVFCIVLTGDLLAAVCTYTLIPRTNNAVEFPPIATLSLTVPASTNIAGHCSAFQGVTGGANGDLCFPFLPGGNFIMRAVSSNAASNGTFIFYISLLVDRL